MNAYIHGNNTQIGYLTSIKKKRRCVAGYNWVHPCHTFPASIHYSLQPSPSQSSPPQFLPHHADLGHLSLQLGSRHVLEVVVIAALSAPRVRLHDEVLHVQRSARDPRRVRCLAHRRAELGRSVVSAGLLWERMEASWGIVGAVRVSKRRFIQTFRTCCVVR